jgi:chorismate-pyruvate lyase
VISVHTVESSTYVERETVALQKHLQVWVLLKHWMRRNLVDTFLKCNAALLNKGILEPAERALLRNGRHHYARVVERQCLIKPQEVGVAA